MTFDPQAATRAYIDGLGPAALAKAEAYTTGGHWLMLGGLVVAAVVTAILVRLRLLDRLEARLAKRGRALRNYLVFAAYFLLSALLTLPWTIYSEWWRERWLRPRASRAEAVRPHAARTIVCRPRARRGDARRARTLLAVGFQVCGNHLRLSWLHSRCVRRCLRAMRGRACRARWWPSRGAPLPTALAAHCSPGSLRRQRSIECAAAVAQPTALYSMEGLT